MIIRRLVFVLVLLFAGMSVKAVAQQATLVVPEELNIITVNNTKYTSKLFSNDDVTLKLEPGEHRIVVEYDVIWDISTDDHVRILSKPFQISFTAEPARQYSIQLPSFDDVDSAQHYAEKPAFKLIDRSTSQVASAEAIYQETAEQSLFERFNLLAGGNVKRPQTTASGSYVAAIPLNNSATTKQSATDKKGDLPLAMLQYWWNNATAQQRKHFIGSIQ